MTKGAIISIILAIIFLVLAYFAYKRKQKIEKETEKRLTVEDYLGSPGLYINN